MTKQACDICEKKVEALGGNLDIINPHTGEPWWICNDCFEKADAIAATADRWPDGRDYEQLRKARR